MPVSRAALPLSTSSCSRWGGVRENIWSRNYFVQARIMIWILKSQCQTQSTYSYGYTYLDVRMDTSGIMGSGLTWRWNVSTRDGCRKTFHHVKVGTS